jgi:predicted ATPase/DNA-binding SARP family transcriptional activator
MRKLFLFGSPRFEIDGINIKFTRRKAMALLANLIASGQPQSRATLLTLLYPEFDQSGAHSNLRRDLSELKKSLGEQLLLIDREQIGLMPQTDLWVDVKEYQAHIETVRKHHPKLKSQENTLPCSDCQIALTRAVSLYTADFMSGFSLPGSREFEEWQFFQVENLRQSLADALQLLINGFINQQDYEAAILYGRRWLFLDPLHEPAHRQLMRLYASSGHQSAALHQFEECVRILHEELKVEPDKETSSLYEEIRNRRFSIRKPGKLMEVHEVPGTNEPYQVQHNLPPPDNPLIGRDGELKQIIDCLRDKPECRLITLVGPGGIGKTRLAIEAASCLAVEPACPFCEGIYFVSLASLSQVDSIITAIADAIQLPLLPNPTERSYQLLNYLQPKRLLLLLDNFEGFITKQSIQLLVDLVSKAPQVKLLVTSRVRLNTHFEQVIPLQGLEIPVSEKELVRQPVTSMVAGSSALQLFVQRAKRLKPDFEVDSNNIEAIVKICQMVEGMPLGIELASAWLNVLTPAEIMTEISTSLDFLATDWVDIPERHQSLRAVFDSSWNLLTEAERTALIKLTIFQGDFSRQAAQAVTNESIYTLLALQNKSWLQYQNNGRYNIHELLCQYASEKLRIDPSTYQLALQHVGVYYRTFLQEQSKLIKGTQQRQAYDAIASEFENIRLVWQWMVEQGQVGLVVDQMLFPLFRFAEVRAKSFEFTQLLELAIKALTNNSPSVTHPNLQPILMITRATFDSFGHPLHNIYTYSILKNKTDIQQAWNLTRGNIETLQSMGYWGIVLSYLFGIVVDKQQAVGCLRQLQSYYRIQNQRWELANTLSFLANVLTAKYVYHEVSTSTLDEVRQLTLEAMLIFQELGDNNETGYTLKYLSEINFFQGKYHEAIAQLQTAQANLHKVGEWRAVVSIDHNIAWIYLRMGDFESAFHYLQIVCQNLQDIGDRIGAAGALSAESMYALRYSDLEHARQTRQKCLSMYQAAGHALGIAWATWEMGEISRVGGDLATAKGWFESARLLFENLDDPTSPIFIHRGLGEIAESNADYNLAKYYFQESIQQARNIPHPWSEAYALCGMGRAETGLGDPKAAQEHFFHALHLAREIDALELLLIAISGYVNLLAKKSNYEQAVELGSMVINHKLSWNETKSQMSALLQSIQLNMPDQSLPVNWFATAQERGRNLAVEVAVNQLIL